MIFLFVPLVGLEPTLGKIQAGYEPAAITTSAHSGIKRHWLESNQL